MRNKILALCILFGWSPGAGAADFAAVTPGRSFQFPRDHGAHSEFKTEWWYFTGHLQDGEGKLYGFQWTVFRSALKPPSGESRPSASPWRAEQIFLGHLALSDLGERSFRFEEGAARAALGLAG
ncbi:MAG TPA: lipocalin-like domain-containing protein, partial [bacterium]|nr:lipocalin-like domain-containing protein [bacterium]